MVYFIHSTIPNSVRVQILWSKKKKYNIFFFIDLFNATSFFVCLTTFIWCLLWFFHKEEPPLRRTITLGEINERERLRREAAVVRSADDHYHIDDEPLPSYYELPIPPKYVQQQDIPSFTVPPPEAHASTQHATLPDYPSSSSNTTLTHPTTSVAMVHINTLPENSSSVTTSNATNQTTTIEIPSPTATVISISPEPSTTNTTTNTTNPITYSNVQNTY